MPIKFGTDGWRAIIAKDYTFANVQICTQAICNMLKANKEDSKGIIIGYDTRFLSKEFAESAAQVMTANKITTYLCDRPAPTPVITHNVITKNTAGAIIITASHNPPNWNGFKYKPDYGGSASTEIVNNIEQEILKINSKESIKSLSSNDLKSSIYLNCFNPNPSYIQHISSLVDLEKIRNSGLSIGIDSMYGSGSGYLSNIISGGTARTYEINAEYNPSFPGIKQPEPIKENLSNLMNLVKENNKINIGLATDGDADRLGVINEKGEYISTLEVFSLICLYKLKILKEKGAIVKSITMTNMIDKIGDIYKVQVYETPVGFKHLGKVMMEQKALIAGEESGGYAFKGNIPERDGILSGLIFLEMLVQMNKTASELIEMLFDEVGSHVYQRIDLEIEENEKESLNNKIKYWAPTNIGASIVKEKNDKDGFKYILEGGYWALIRFSGTEPLLRLHVEGKSENQVTEILNEIKNYIFN
ncbi:MAG: phosphomannomutase [Chloroflexi bacterium]|nr:phosphomannomutase [Chloroflexota bacterium]|tara:strand:+ start:38017 stop:39441 length:1425 start_codon:yes stop_codon:yes gene_type:complete